MYESRKLKTIILFQVIIMMALSFFLFAIEPIKEKDILRGVSVGLMVSLLIQFILFRLKPMWFDVKVKRHAHEAKN